MDLDGVNGVDGIIYADLLAQKPTGDWNNSNGHYELPAAEAEANYRTYVISQTNQVPKKPTDSTKNLFDATGRDVVKLADGNQDGKSKRFYVMGLENVLNGTSEKMNWTIACGKTATTGAYNWRLPTQQEWSMFGKAFSLTSGNYTSYGLSNYYWSSTENTSDTSNAWSANFLDGYLYNSIKTNYFCVRLCTTF